MKAVSCEGLPLNQVLARNLIRDFSIPTIRRLFAKDVQKLDGVGQGVYFAYLPTSFGEALNLSRIAVSIITFRILPFRVQDGCNLHSLHYWSHVYRST
jgi:hypothetical protein